MEDLHKAVDKLQGRPIYNQIALLQSLRGVGFLSAIILIVEIFFDLFPAVKKLYAYFSLEPTVKQSSKFNGDKVHMSKRGSSLARRILHIVTKKAKSPVNPVIYDYYIRICAEKKRSRWYRDAQNL